MIQEQGKILVIDDNKDILLTTRVVLKKQFKNVVTDTDPDQIIELISSHQFDVILLDMNFKAGATSGKEGLEWLKKIQQTDPNSVVIMMTAYGDIDLAVQAIKEGAIDFIVKPWDNKKLLATVTSAYKLSQSKREITVLKTRQDHLSQAIDQNFTDIIGKSESMQHVFEVISKVSKTDANVLLLGENGTGKELAARAIHRNSNRADHIFVTVDLGAVSETLFESELFGHVKGAFTDAREDRMGRFEIASGGTLFLDEIGNLSLPLQSKILTAIQNREITRVGSNHPTPINIRLVCATNMNLHEMVAQKKFREDLMYRINTVEIKIPSLRERVSDIPELTNHFLNLYAKKYNKSGIRLSRESYLKLNKYNWPGNVRELQHVVERAVIMCDKNLLGPSDFLIERTDTDKQPDSLNMEEVEKQTILNALQRNHNNISKAAEEMGFARTTLYRKMKKYGI